MKLARLLGLVASGLALATTHTVILADPAPTSWTIQYAPIGTIPTLSEWGMLILSGLLVVAAVYSLRKKVGSKALLSIAALCAIGLGSVLGNRIIGEAQAYTCVAQSMSSESGGTLSFDADCGAVTNTTLVPLQIISISPTSGSTLPDTACIQNLIVQAGHACYVSYPH